MVDLSHLPQMQEFRRLFPTPAMRLAQRDSEQITPQEERAILGTMARGFLAPIEVLGTVLDTPGSGVRALLAGRNPFTAMSTPSERISGRELLYGDQEDQPGIGDNVLGFGAEVLLDPLAWIPGLLAGKVLTKGGKLAKQMGLLSRAEQVGERGRVGLMRSTLEDLLRPVASDAPGEAMARWRAAKTAAKKSGIELRDLIPKGKRGEQLAGPYGLQVPFGPTLAVWKGGGPGGLAEKVAAYYDRLGGNLAAGKYSPIRALAPLFSRAVAQTTSPVGQRIMRGATRRQDIGRAQAREAVAESLRLTDDLGLRQLPEADFRRMAEGVAPRTPAFQQAIDPIERLFQGQQALRDEFGLSKRDFQDAFIAHYWPRKPTKFVRQGIGAGALNIPVADPTMKGRLRLLTDLPGGSEGVRDLTRQAAQIVRAGGTKRDIRTMLQAANVPDTWAAKGGQKAGRVNRLASWFAKEDPERLELGFFGNHPLIDAQEAATAAGEYIALKRGILEGLSDARNTADFWRYKYGLKDPAAIAGFVAQNPRTVMPLKDALKRLGWKKGGVDVALNKFGAGATTPVPRELIDDLIRAKEAFRDPKSLSGLTKTWDSFTNAFRFGNLATPPFHSRNFLSSQIQNIIAGVWSAWSLRATWSLLGGRAVAGLDEVAKQGWVKQALRKSGLKPTTENVADILRQRAFAEEVVDTAATMGGHIQGPATGRLEEALAQVPGGFGGKSPATKPLSGKMLKTALGMEPGLSKFPASITRNAAGQLRLKSNTRGIGEAAQSTFGLAVAHERMGYHIEASARMAPWLELVRRGVDPSEAARRVRELQGAYANRYLTKFEQNVMARYLLPFYRFTKSMVPYTLRTLWEKPGGAMAQTVRAVNAARGEEGGPVPPHIAETASIPISEETPILGSLIGPAEEGQRYLTGFGFMHEDPARLLGPLASMLPLSAGFLTPGLGMLPNLLKIPAAIVGGTAASQALPYELTGEGLKELGLEAISRLHPIPKALFEYPAGISTFMRGPTGGRPLEELDPTVGRTLANILDEDKPISTPRDLEYLLGASPFAWLLRAGRTLSDRRKGAVAKALNLLTGVRVADVSPVQQDKLISQQLNKMMEQLGGKKFGTAYFSAEDLERMTPQQQATVTRLMELQRAIKRRSTERAKRAKETKKESKIPKGMTRLEYAKELSRAR